MFGFDILIILMLVSFIVGLVSGISMARPRMHYPPSYPHHYME